MFAADQERLPKELAARDIDTMHDANRHLAERYRAAFNEEFAVPATEPGHRCGFRPFQVWSMGRGPTLAAGRGGLRRNG